jgi:hypothetical protein
VSDVAVDFREKTATITMSPGRELDAAACEQAFANTPYKIIAFEPRP